MYHAIVRYKIRKLFEAVSRGDAKPVLKSFANRFEHSFLGESHALSGKRHTLATTRRWYERLYRLLPDIQFELKKISISGTPWNTIASVEWRETNSGTDGVRTYNEGVHVARLCWGRVTQLIICPDTAGLLATLDRLALAGNAEAKAGPIID